MISCRNLTTFDSGVVRFTASVLQCFSVTNQTLQMQKEELDLQNLQNMVLPLLEDLNPKLREKLADGSC